jgi:hypothetical protein
MGTFTWPRAPAAATWASRQNLSIVARGIDGVLYHDFWSPSTPWQWQSLGGYSITDPTIIWPGSSQLHVFVLGDLAHAGHTYDDWYSGTWTWTDFGVAPNGSSFVAQPTAGSWSSTFVDAFATSADGNLYTKHFDGSNWGSWQLAGMPPGTPPNPPNTWVNGAPASVDFVQTVPVQVSALVRGFDAAGYVCWWSNPACISPWDKPGGVITNDPAMISIAGQQLDVFVRGSDFAVYHVGYTTTGGWTSWDRLGGFMT